MALIFNYIGQPERTQRLVAQAMQLNPHYPSHYIFAIGHAEYLMGQHANAIAAFKRAIARNPDTLGPHAAYLAALYMALGRTAEAQAEVAEVLRVSPHFSLEVARQRALYKDAGVLESYLACLRDAGLR